MARETKEQRRIRIELEAIELEAQNKQQFPEKLLMCLHRAQRHGANLKFDPTGITVTRHDWYREINLNVVYSNDCFEELERLECLLDDADAELQEAARLRKVKEEALNKLTAEERTVLGLERR